MKLAGMGRFSAVGRARGARRAATRTDPPTRAGAGHRRLLELQWQGRGGRFRHLAVGFPGLRSVLGTLGIAALLALAGASSVGSGRAAVCRAINLAAHENAELKVRQRALRERAFDLADLINRRAEQGQRIGSLAGAPSPAAEAPYPRPPDEDAGDEALVLWLSEQGERVEALGNELDAVRLEMGAKHASL